VVRFEWLSPGTHVSSVGSTLEGGFELDPAIVERADVVVVEQRDSAFAPLPAGAPELEPRGRDGVVEIGEIIAGAAVGRTSGEQITLYKSVGVAVQDLAAAALVLAVARERGVGQEIELEEINV
jgi:alanine dehydrogenase